MVPKVLKRFVVVIAQSQLTFSSYFDNWWITEEMFNDKHHLVDDEDDVNLSSGHLKKKKKLFLTFIEKSSEINENNH